MSVTLHLRHGDCLVRLQELGEGSVGAVVCDPPYELSFMGKGWDGTGIAYDPALWAHLYRVLVPGGMVKAFSATRTFHRMAAAMQEAGFTKIGVQAWNYGSGFPKSLSISKAIDKAAGADTRTQNQVQDYIKERREAKGLSKSDVDKAVFGGTTRYSWVEGRGGERANEVYLPTPEEWVKLKALLDLDDRFDGYIKTAIPSREHRARADGGKAVLVGVGQGDWGYQQDGERWDGGRRLTTPATDAARTWEGWGTALKPSWEPVLVGMKPE